MKYKTFNRPAFQLSDTTIEGVCELAPMEPIAFRYCAEYHFDGHTFYVGADGKSKMQKLIEASSGLQAVDCVEVAQRGMDVNNPDCFFEVFKIKLNEHHTTIDFLIGRFTENNFQKVWKTIFETGLLESSFGLGLPF